MPLELAGHAQMHTPNTSYGLQGCHQIFPSALPVPHRHSAEASYKLIRTSRAGNGPWPADFNLRDFEVDKTVCQSPTDRLDFREFRQRPQAGSSSASAKLLVLMPPSTPCRPL